jgi:hypothetical protein
MWGGAMDFETVVQILVAAQALVRLAMAVEQRLKLRRQAKTVDVSAARTPVVPITAYKEVQR